MKDNVQKILLIVVCALVCASFIACNKTVDVDDVEVIPDDVILATDNDVDDVEVIPDGVILATDNGVVANDLSCAKENTAALNALISDADEGETIYLPRGNYYFAHNDGNANNLLVANDKKNLTLQGNGATLINAEYNGENTSSYQAGNTLTINGCTNFKVKGLNFDCYRYTQVVGTILEDSVASKLFIKIDERFLHDGEKPAITGKEYIGAVGVLDKDGAEVAESYDGDILHINCSLDEDGIMTVSGILLLEKLAYEIEVGATAILRFSMANYSSPIFECYNTNGLTFENVNSYSSPSSTMYVAANNSNFTFDNFNVAPKKDSPQVWGSNVDVIHINGLRGALTIKNCLFKGLGDDALNIHSRAGTDFVIDKESKTLTLSPSAEYNFALENDTIEFFDLNFVSQGSAKVIAKDNNVLTLDEIPENVDNSSVIQNKSYCADAYLENVTVDGGRARAFLFQTDNVTVKNCTVKNMGLAAIIVSPDINEPMAWFEIGPSKNVVIEGCTFYNVCSRNNEACYGAIVVKCDHDGSGISRTDGGKTVYFPAGVHKNVTIKNNTFDNIGSGATFICATETVNVTGNTIVNGYANVNANKGKYYKHALCFINCKDVDYAGNSGVNDDVYSENLTD